MLLATLRVVILSSMVGIVCHRLLGEQVVRDLEVKVVQDGTHGTFCSLLFGSSAVLIQHSPYGATRKHQER
jgi:hypothetical protein